MKGYDDKSTKKERPEQTNLLDSAQRKLKKKMSWFIKFDSI